MIPTKQTGGTEGSGSRWPLWAALSCALLAFSSLAVLALLQFAANNFNADVGSFLQAFHRTLDGEWMQATLDGREQNWSRWAGHTEFFMALLVPIFALFPRAETLFLAQAAAISLAGLAVFLLARERWGNGTHSLLAALAFWTFPFLTHLQFSGFHADPFFMAPYLLAWLFHVRGRPGRFWAMIALATSIKEYACVFNFLLGLFLLRENRRRAQGLFALSLFQFLVLTPVTQWFFREAAIQLEVGKHILPLGGGVAGFVRTAAANVATPDYLLKAATVAALFGWSWIRHPRGLILVAPLYAAMSVLNFEPLFIHHHFALLMPALFIALVEGLAAMDPIRRGRYLRYGLVLPSSLLLVIHPYSQISSRLREVFLHPGYRNLFHYRITPHDRLTDSLLAAIPGHLAVATEHNLRPKAADREWAFIHPHPRDSLRADRYLFDFFETLRLERHDKHRLRCAALLGSPDFHVEHFEDGVLLLAKGAPAPGEGSRFLWQARPDTGATADPASQASGPSLSPPPESGIPVEVRPRLAETSRGYLLEVDYQGSFGPAEALVSVFTRPAGDSLRVLHLPGYVEARLTGLPSGHYREAIPFSGPPDLLAGGWHWEIRFYKHHPHIPLVGRADQVLARVAVREGWEGPAPGK